MSWSLSARSVHLRTRAPADGLGECVSAGVEVWAGTSGCVAEQQKQRHLVCSIATADLVANFGSAGPSALLSLVRPDGHV